MKTFRWKRNNGHKIMCITVWTNHWSKAPMCAIVVIGSLGWTWQISKKKKMSNKTSCPLHLPIFFNLSPC